MGGNVKLYYDRAGLRYVKPGQVIKTVAATGTPERVTTDESIEASRVVIWGKKAARTANTGTVWIGFESGDGSQPNELFSGSSLVWNAVEGAKFKLSDFYVDVETNGDGVVVEYH